MLELEINDMCFKQTLKCNNITLWPVSDYSEQ